MKNEPWIVAAVDEFLAVLPEIRSKFSGSFRDCEGVKFVRDDLVATSMIREEAIRFFQERFEAYMQNQMLVLNESKPRRFGDTAFPLNNKPNGIS